MYGTRRSVFGHKKGTVRKPFLGQNVPLIWKHAQTRLFRSQSTSECAREYSMYRTLQHFAKCDMFQNQNGMGS